MAGLWRVLSTARPLRPALATELPGRIESVLWPGGAVAASFLTARCQTAVGCTAAGSASLSHPLSLPRWPAGAPLRAR